jgi:hypothetical protein
MKEVDMDVRDPKSAAAIGGAFIIRHCSGSAL